MHKRNTFTDFVDAARALVERGYTTPERLAARGRSAGGLLMGAVANLAPQLFQVIVAGVPFVDVLTTMLDDTIPLTSLEWDEWGDPHDADAFAYMATYSPYDNVAAQDYSHLYVHTGLNDPRVGYFEPAKWVARLRATKTDQHVLVLKTEMGAGHGGPSGRYNRLRDRAQEDAFVLHHLGIDA
jgi:oligopeptidase B